MKDEAAGSAWAGSLLGVLPAEIVDEVTRLSEPIVVPAGDFVYESEVSVVESGLFRAFVANSGGRQVTVSYARRSNVIGLTRLTGREFPLAFQALSPGRILQLGNERFSELVGRFPELGWAAATEVTSQCDELFGEMTRLVFGQVRQRMAFHLLRMTSVDGKETAGPVRKRDLVLAVGSVAEVIRKNGLQFQATGLVSVTPDGFFITDRVGLDRVASAQL